VAGRDAETTHPVNVEAALGAVEGEVLELAFEIGLHLQELKPKHLGVGDERIRAAVPHLDRLVDELIGLGCLLGDGLDSLFEDVSLSRVATGEA
jgi:hypothetical protein